MKAIDTYEPACSESPQGIFAEAGTRIIYGPQGIPKKVLLPAEGIDQLSFGIGERKGIDRKIPPFEIGKDSFTDQPPDRR